jgi:hypothetical protein
MNNGFISDDEIQRALDYLRDSAPKIANAKAEVVRCDRMLKCTKALAMKASGEKSAAAQEREALCSKQYEQAVDDEFNAVEHYEHMKALRDAAAMKIEAWRTASSNYRSMKIG